MIQVTSSCSVIRLTVGFDNMTRPAGPATLRNAPETRFPGGSLRQASGAALQVHYPAEMEGYDPARMAYLLLEEIYHWFGYDSQAIPYVDNTGPTPKMDAMKIVEEPLPTELPEIVGFY
jgi:hypothetical protein